MSRPICALSTPPGEGGVAVIRLSGPGCHEALARAFFRRRPRVAAGTCAAGTAAPAQASAAGTVAPAAGTAAPAQASAAGTVAPAAEAARDARPTARRAPLPPPGRLVHGYVARDGRVLDEVMAVRFDAPRSYTGEDMAEIHCHGGMLVVSQVLSLLMELGCAPAQPGEFTQRAFLNGKMDLSQAEAVMDLIHARGEMAARSALDQLGGAVGRRVGAIQAALTDLTAEVEASLDYPEEDLGVGVLDVLPERIGEVLADLSALLAHQRTGRMIREGALVAILGAPNVGKSSLLNAILGQDRAIVTELPGTTRDVLQETCRVHGLAVRFADTAGLRETADPVERIGVDRAQRVGERAALTLWVMDAARPETALPAGMAALAVANKCDLAPAPAGYLPVSASTGEGVEALLEAVYARLMAGDAPEDALVTNLRHLEALQRAQSSLRAAEQAARAGMTPDCVAVDLRQGLLALGEITGASADEAVLDAIFSKFCLGK